jgi:ABC-type transport system involved in Fe-S cluster assembly, ATPase component
MLEIKDLKASINNKPILKGLNLNIKPGELHAIMGPNGSGKSTLANVLSGKSGYEISGTLTFNGQDLKTFSVEERAQKGMFLAFQYPLEIPGVNTNIFFKNIIKFRSQGKWR